MADVLVVRGAAALRTASFHNNDRRRFRHRTLSEMAELGSSGPMPTTSAKSESTSTDSELALTPEMGSGSSSSPSDVGGVVAGRVGETGAGTTKPTETTSGATLDGATAASATPSAIQSAIPSAMGSPQLIPEHAIADTPMLGPTTPADKSPFLGSTSSRHASFSGSSSYQEDWDIPPLDRLSVLDLLDNFALPQQLEKLSKGISAQTRKLRRSRDALKSRGQGARSRMVEEWRQRAPSAEEQLERYRRRMRTNVERLGRQWNDTRVITMREKVSFICGVLNIFISGYLIGGWPEWMPTWYTAQLCYFMPIRFYTYRRRGYHYFLADLCYFVNMLLLLSIWLLPASRRLFVATYCLAFGNNAVAIVMWRNSLVFHSFDKVTSLFIHVMPCATLHCMVHLLHPDLQRRRFPAIYAVRHSPPGTPGAYANVVSMLAWSTIPYAVWQLSYYFFITVRRRDKIAAGRPTSFTWLRRSYSKTLIGRVVLSLPLLLQEPAFMMIQYLYAVLTMLPCPIWFYHRRASAAFLFSVFTWSIYNGATYYIDVFGNRFQKELEAMKLEVAKWHPVNGDGDGGGGTSAASTVDGIHSNATSPPLGPRSEHAGDVCDAGDADVTSTGSGSNSGSGADTTNEEARLGRHTDSIDEIPLLDSSSSSSTIDNKDDKGEKCLKSPGAASAAAAMTEAMMTGVDWDQGAKDVARRRGGR